ncbi:sodium-independent sulfate anion transporter isoform X1 [Hydra vulgaris]|uniref:sodium-independent sulfate anion transporter isoform X1 n=1 Tax=Hydra vulgaris TaxID=6087 RepID=UPI001F5E9FB5|nr:sodium-independent sulfate anion transporter-like [Hydra vulgaris]
MSFANIKKTDVINFLKKFFPILVWLPQYNFKKFRGDFIAGLTCGVVVIPQSIAFANLAKLPPQNGLYASLTPGLIYGIFGTSKDVSTGTAVTLGLYTSRFNPTNSTIGASLLSFLTGIILVLMGIFKLGFLIKYVPQLVISAFVSATAITIIVTQFSNLLGIKGAPVNVFEILKHIILYIKNKNNWDICMSACCLIILTFFILLSNLKLEGKPVLKKIVWFLCAARMAIVCLFATLAVYIFHIYGYQQKFSMAGNIPKGLPQFQNPFEPWKDGNVTKKKTSELIDGYGASLFILPVIMFIEQMSITKAFGKKFNYKVKAQNELIAIGMMNIVASFFGGWTVGGSFTRSAVNSMSGAQTPLAGVISGIIALIALEFMTPAFYYIPSAALGAMMLMAVLTMIEMSLIKKIWKIYKWDLLPFLAAFGTSFYKLEYGVLAGTGISILIMLSREARPKYYLEKDDSKKSLTILLMENLTYPGVDALNKTIYSEINKNFEIKTLYLDMSTMVRIDFTILKNFEFMKDELFKMGISLQFINFTRDSVKYKFYNAGLIPDNPIFKDQTNFLSMLLESKTDDAKNYQSEGEISKIKYLKTGVNEEDDVEFVGNILENNNFVVN